MTPEQRTVFLQRTASIYRHQKERARDAGAGTLGYGLEQLRLYVQHRLAGSDCAYCGCVLTPKNFSLDHGRALVRGGAWDLSNLVVCCGHCNRAKGPLSSQEYAELLELLRRWPERARKNVLARLREGGRRAFGG